MISPARSILVTDTDFAHYEVLDMVYEGRPARVLYSGERQAAQSGVATDGQPDLLFDYNQRLRELVTFLKPKRVLLIGGGVYTLPMALLKLRPKMNIDVVEIDPGLDQIARDHFGFKSSRRLKIYHQDGREFLEQATGQYDLIIMDAYTNFAIPSALTEARIVDLVQARLEPHGVVASNVIAAYHGKRSQVLHRLAGLYEARFVRADIFPASHGVSPWLPQNFILVAQLAESRVLDTMLRYPALRGSNQPFNLSRDLGR